MGVFNENSIMGAAGAGGEGYQIEKSCRFNAASSSKLSRTPSSAGNRRTYTISYWFKRGNFTSGSHMYPFDTNGDGNIYILNSSEKLGSQTHGGGYHTTTQAARDITNWYHLVIAVDTTQGTSSNRVKHYLNGSQITIWDSNSMPSQNAQANINNTVAHTIGGKSGGNYFDGYMADFYLIDGQQLTPSDFGEFDDDYNHWKPIEYTGTYGTNGFYLPFTNAGTKHALTRAGGAIHSTSQKKFGSSSIYFDGSGDKVNATSDHDTFKFGTGDFTIEAWLRWDAQGVNKTLVGNRTGGGHNYWMFYLSTSYELAFSSGAAILCRGGSAIPATTWIHVAAVRQNGTMRLYRGGVQVQTAGGVTNDFSDDAKIYIGSGDNQGNTDFAGYMDDIRVSNVCRYPDGTTFTPHTTSHVDDANTVLLVQSDEVVTSYTPSAASNWNGDTGSFNFGSGSVERSSGDDSIWSSAVLSGDFTIQFTLTESDNLSYGVIDASQTGSITSAATWYRHSNNLNSFAYHEEQHSSSGHYHWWVGTTEEAHSKELGEGSVVQFKRVGGTITVYDDGTLKHTFTTKTFTGDMVFAVATDGGGSNGNITNLTFTSNGSGTIMDSTTFTDSSGVTGALGNDASGNNNHFTPTNLSSHDQIADTPTNNFCTMNSLDNYYYNATFSEGNLQVATTGGSGNEPSLTATHALRSGKWYWENYLVYEQSHPYAMVGITSRHGTAGNDYIGKFADSYAYYSRGYSGGNLIVSGNYTGYGTATSYVVNDIIGCALDLDNNKMYWHKNGTYLNSGNPGSNSNGYSIDATPHSGDYYPSVGDFGNNNVTWHVNFGQDGTFAGKTAAGGNSDGEGYGNFKYAVPSGFKSLCAKNLPDPAVKPKENFNTVLYTGNSSAPRTITGVGFQPDMTWIKPRTLAGSWTQVDSVRGGNGSYLWRLASDYGQIESNLSGSGYVRSFASDGFVLGNDQHVNTSYNYLSWNWKTSSTSSGTTSGSGTSKSYTAKYNADAGFSIIGYEGNGTSGHQIPHHLGAPPELILIKARNYNGTEWAMGTEQTLLSMDWNHVLYFDQAVAFSNWNLWHDTAPNNTHFYVSSSVSVNHNGNGMIAYCWRSIPGYCKIGSYHGNANADGAFIHTGFRPAMVIIKNVNQSGNHFVGFDNVRSPTNPSTQFIFPSDHAVENTSNGNNLDFLSNGFKLRKSDGWYNHGNYKYLYIAFAEQPFKYSNAK